VPSEDYIDFTVRRPTIDRRENDISLEWPDTTLYLARPEGATRDFLLLVGFEPNFAWRTYVENLVDYVDGLGAKTLVSLRAFPGNVPHTRPAPVTISASDVELELQFGVQSRGSRYQGPTDLSGVLAAQLQTLRWQTADLTVMQPYYFPRMPNAAAMMALVKVLDHAFGTKTPVSSLEETAR
jgi:predicted ATP-grasp superfamily ATP-dependent carboligase